MIKIDTDTKVVGGWFGDGLDSIGDEITLGIYNGFLAILDVLCDVIFWVSKTGILVCLVIYFCSKDQKAVTWGWKMGFLYLIFAILKNQL